MVKADPYRVDFMRKIAGVNIEIVKDDPESITPYTVKVSVLAAHKSKILRPSREEILDGLREAGEARIQMADGTVYEVPTEDSEQGEA